MIDYRQLETTLAGVLGARDVGIREVTRPEPQRVQSIDGSLMRVVAGAEELYLKADVFDAKARPPLGEVIDVDGGHQILITVYNRNFGDVDQVHFTLISRTFDLWAEMRAALASGGRR